MGFRFSFDLSSRRAESLAWLLRLQRGLRESEGPQLAKWLMHSRNRSCIAKDAVDSFAPEVVAVLSEMIPMERFLTKHPRRYASAMIVIPERIPLERFHTKANRRYSPAAAGLAILVAVCVIVLLIYFLNRILPSKSGVFATGISVGRRMNLEDGSDVTLNAETKIIVSFSGDLRLVNLLYGEALFEVSPDARRPFRVHAGGRDLVANAATVFDIQVLAAKSAVLTVFAGKAEVAPAVLGAQDQTIAMRSDNSMNPTFTIVGPLEALQFGPEAQSSRKISHQEARAQLDWQRRQPPLKSREPLPRSGQ